MTFIRLEDLFYIIMIKSLYPLFIKVVKSEGDRERIRFLKALREGVKRLTRKSIFMFYQTITSKKYFKEEGDNKYSRRQPDRTCLVLPGIPILRPVDLPAPGGTG